MAEDLSKRLYVKEREAWEAAIRYKRFSNRELEVQVLENGIVLPARRMEGAWKGGVCDSDFNFVAGFSRHNEKGTGFSTINSSYVVDQNDIVDLDEDVIFGGVLIGHFGHFMMECWCRLWYVIEHPELQSKILFLTTTHGGYKPWFDNFFRLMGIDLNRIIYVKEPMQCRSVTVPDQSQYSPRNFTKEFFIPYQAIKSHVTPAAPKKLYLTRKDYEGEKNVGVHCYNEKYFEDFFVAHGFEAVSMETLKLEEQISLIMGADEVAATMGTLTHWAMFCKPTAKFIVLTRTHAALNLQLLVNEASNIKNYFVDASKNFLHADWNTGVCMLGSNKYWKAFVADYFGEQIDENDDALYFDESLDEYITFWFKKYARLQDLWISSVKNMCNRIVTLETELNKERPLLNYRTHVGMKGWYPWKIENQLSGPLDQQFDIQAIILNFTKPFHDVYYSVYYNDKEGWSREVQTNEPAGTIGRSKSITGIKIRLDEAGAAEYDILYRLHKFDGQWTPWAQNGEELLTQGAKTNSIQIRLERRPAGGGLS